MQVSLKGRRALVTGAGRGIGEAIAVALARAGADVLLGYGSSKERAEARAAALEREGCVARALRLDVSSAQEVDQFFESGPGQEPLDILVNNAGLARDGLLIAQREEDWDRVLDVNLTGAWRLMRRALRGMIRSRWGRVVNVASIQALRGGRGQANYAAAKAGLLALTRAAALEVAARNVTVNAVLPGFVRTDMTASLERRAGDEILAHLPANRFGTPEDVAGPVLFLVSEAASYVTGHGLVIDGGLSIQ